MTVQGPVKKEQPHGMSHRGASLGPCLTAAAPQRNHGVSPPPPPLPRPIGASSFRQQFIRASCTPTPSHTHTHAHTRTHTSHNSSPPSLSGGLGVGGGGAHSIGIGGGTESMSKWEGWCLSSYCKKSVPLRGDCFIMKHETVVTGTHPRGGERCSSLQVDLLFGLCVAGAPLVDRPLAVVPMRAPCLPRRFPHAA